MSWTVNFYNHAFVRCNLADRLIRFAGSIWDVRRDYPNVAQKAPSLKGADSTLPDQKIRRLWVDKLA